MVLLFVPVVAPFKQMSCVIGLNENGVHLIAVLELE